MSVGRHSGRHGNSVTVWQYLPRLGFNYNVSAYSKVWGFRVKLDPFEFQLTTVFEASYFVFKPFGFDRLILHTDI